MFSLKKLMAGAVAAGGPVQLTEWDYTYSGLGSFPTVPTTVVTLAINRNGSMTVSGTGGTEGGTEPNTVVDWFKPEGAAVGDDYEVRITVNSGSFSTGTVGSWLALSSNRTWTNTFNSIGTETIDFTIEIRPTSGSVLASANCTIQQSGAYA